MIHILITFCCFPAVTRMIGLIVLFRLSVFLTDLLLYFTFNFFIVPPLEFFKTQLCKILPFVEG